jgi:hypothetical protein
MRPIMLPPLVVLVVRRNCTGRETMLRTPLIPNRVPGVGVPCICDSANPKATDDPAI